MKIIYYPNKILTTKAKSVEAVDKEINRLMDDMLQLTIDSNGYGLAANQVGILKRVFVVIYEDELITIANPEITEFLGEKKPTMEACLSFAGVGCIIKRYTGVKIKGLNRDNKEITLILHNKIAQIVQHEIDHLNGKTLAQIAGKYDRRRLITSYKKAIKTIKRQSVAKKSLKEE